MTTQAAASGVVAFEMAATHIVPLVRGNILDADTVVRNLINVCTDDWSLSRGQVCYLT